MNILILSYYKYPDGDAGSVRHHALAKLFLSLGHDTTVIGMGQTTNFRFFSCDGVPYTSFRHRGQSFLSKIRNLTGYKSRLKKYLLQKKDTDAILLNDIPYSALRFLKKYAGKHFVKLIYDSVEWYSPEQFIFGKRNILYYLKDKYNTAWIDAQFSVATISRYLESHFQSRGIRTVRIPALADTQAVSAEKHINFEKLTLMYAGSPGKKDNLREIIGGCALLSPCELARTELRIAGISKERLISQCGVSAAAIEKLGEHLILYGRLPHAKVTELLAEADFTVLLRPPELRYAKAGFPTKIAESLANSTPVLCNITSDLGDYLTDGNNCILAEHCTAEAFAASVRKALCLTAAQKTSMYISARKCAEENFDFRLYKDKIKKLLQI